MKTFLLQYIGIPILDPSEEDCIVPCPVDCVVSTWSDWTPCSASCGLGESKINAL